MEQLPDYENMTCEELVKTIVDMQASAKYNREIFDELFDYLLFAYSPENAAKVVQENASILKDEELRFFVLKKAHGAYQAEIFLEALNMLAFLVDNEVALVKEGALSLCIRAMATDATNARTQSLGCKVIANLAGCVQVRNFLGRTAIPIVLQALKNQKKYVEVVKSSLGALANLCYHSASNKKIFCANQGPRSLSHCKIVPNDRDRPCSRCAQGARQERVVCFSGSCTPALCLVHEGPSGDTLPRCS